MTYSFERSLVKFDVVTLILPWKDMLYLYINRLLFSIYLENAKQ